MFNNLGSLTEITKRVLSEGVALVKAESSSIPKLTVETVNNHLYFYADVDTDRCLALIRSLHELDTSLRNERLTRNLPNDYPLTPIWLHIQSNGGSLFTGLAVSDQIAQFKTPIYSVVEGICASAATLISMSCAKRFMLPRSFLLIHQLSTVAWGKYEDIKDEVVLLDMAMSQLTKFYVDRSRLSKKKIVEMLTHDTWMSAEQCLVNGMIDEIKGNE